MSAIEHGAADRWSLRHLLLATMPLLLALSVLELVSGVVLGALESTYLEYPPLLVLVPVMIGMGGNLGAIVAARLSTRLHLGTLELHPRDEALQASVLAVLGLALTVFSLLGVLVYGIGHLLGTPMGLGTILLISMLSGTILAVLAVALAIGATSLAFRRGWDPDDVTLPLVTNLCDVLGVVILSAVALVVL